VYGLAVDASNNVFVAGAFQNTVNFDTGGLGSFAIGKARWYHALLLYR
jgi:hypothetical protein